MYIPPAYRVNPRGGDVPASFFLSVRTLGGSPLLQQGDLDFGPAKERKLTIGFSRGKPTHQG